MRKSMALAAILCGAAITPLMAQITEKPIAPTQTSEGLVAGKILPSGVRAWFGVPFAKPPINNLRWHAHTSLHAMPDAAFAARSVISRTSPLPRQESFPPG